MQVPSWLMGWSKVQEYCAVLIKQDLKKTPKHLVHPKNNPSTNSYPYPSEYSGRWEVMCFWAGQNMGVPHQ